MQKKLKALSFDFRDPVLQTYYLKQITAQSCATKPSDALPASTPLAQPTVARTRPFPLTLLLIIYIIIAQHM